MAFTFPRVGGLGPPARTITWHGNWTETNALFLRMVHSETSSMKFAHAIRQWVASVPTGDEYSECAGEVSEIGGLGGALWIGREGFALVL